MQTAAIAMEVLLGLAFLASGGQKLAGAKGQKELFKHLGYPPWFLSVAGLVEIVGALGMFAGLFSPILAFLAGLLLSAQMIGALVSHVRVRDSARQMVPAGVLLVLAAVLVFLEYSTFGL